MAKHLRIEDYFKKIDLSNLSQDDSKRLQSLRDKINSFSTEKEQAEFIEKRRRKNTYRLWDEEVLGINRGLEIDPSYKDSNKRNLREKTQKRYDIDIENWENYDDIDDDYYNDEKSLRENLQNDVKGWIEYKTGGIEGIKVKLKKYSLIFHIAKFLLLIYIFCFIFNAIYGSVSFLGSTPFKICDTSKSNSMEGGDGYFSKVIEVNGNTLKIPGSLDKYSDYSESSPVNTIVKMSSYTGSDDDRGKGIFVEEDFKDTDVDCNTDYRINMRWEYVNYRVAGKNQYDTSREGYITDKILSGGSSGLNNFSDYNGLKCLVINPENGSGVICTIGYGYDSGSFNANWGPAPGGRFGGMTKCGMEAIGISSFSEVDVYFVDPSISSQIMEGPYNGTFNIASEKGCGVSKNSIGFSSIAEAGVSMALEVPGDKNTGTEAYKSACAKYGLGTPHACAAFVSACVLQSGADSNFPHTCSVQAIKDYFEGDQKVFEKVGEGLTEDKLKPGDILLVKNEKNSHVLVYAGTELIRTKYPNSSANVVQASLNDHQSACVGYSDFSKYQVWRKK